MHNGQPVFEQLTLDPRRRSSKPTHPSSSSRTTTSTSSASGTPPEGLSSTIFDIEPLFAQLDGRPQLAELVASPPHRLWQHAELGSGMARADFKIIETPREQSGEQNTHELGIEQLETKKTR